MTFQHQDVQQACEQGMACTLLTRGFSDEERQVSALASAYFWFDTMEGDQSPKVAEIVSHLLSAELRPALKSWFRRFSKCDTTGFTTFRDYLSNLARERLI
jgi:hypothetical protein